MKTPEQWSEAFHSLNGRWFDDDGNDRVAPMFAAAMAQARREALADVMGEVEEMETQAEVDEGHGGECNRCAAMALREYAGHIRALLETAVKP